MQITFEGLLNFPNTKFEADTRSKVVAASLVFASHCSLLTRISQVHAYCTQACTLQGTRLCRLQAVTTGCLLTGWLHNWLRVKTSGDSTALSEQCFLMKTEGAGCTTKALQVRRRSSCCFAVALPLPLSEQRIRAGAVHACPGELCHQL